jgi:hypothetical protein
MHGIITSFATIAYIMYYKVENVDVKGAYLQTELAGSPIYMKMDKELTTEVISILPKLYPFSHHRGHCCTASLRKCCMGAFSPVDCGMND